MKEKKEEKNNLEKGKDTENMEKNYLLCGPHISEKATFLTEKGFYIFRVKKGAGKVEVKKEVEKKYKVTVESVNVINIPAKKRRLGRTEGKKKGYRKAVVKLKEGESIDFTV